MHRSSESIASLAAALAKAQTELVNPEKSLIGSVKPVAGDATERLFRYASLASGLEIVRKILGQHEIATVQTTAIDQSAGTVNLTTVLAHASGQWIASDWPVCAIADSAEPHRMGAALTYARRYALFTLVGIAGEDDLDAPDLLTPMQKASAPGTPSRNSYGQLNGDHQNPAHNAVINRQGINRDRKPYSKPREPLLDPEASAQLRGRLLTELDALGGGEAAALWAQQCLPEKNRLTRTDALHVEESFQAKLLNLATVPADADVPAATPKPSKRRAPHQKASQRTRSKAIEKQPVDKSVLKLPEPRRIRDRDHVRYVAKQACLICGRRPCDAHHLRFTQSRALGRKVSDEFTVPLCRGHHREVHRCSDEAKWWNAAGIQPTVAARALWLATHPLPTTLDTSAISSVGKREENYETKPILAADPQ
jgi:hypothetical protein